MSHPTITKGEQTRQALLEAAFALFVEKGYHGTSMRLIAKKANLALGGIYNHFANKEEIFKAVLLNYHPLIKIMPQLAECEAGTAESLLRQAGHLLIEEVNQHPHILNLVFIELIELQGVHFPEIIGDIAPQLMGFMARLQSFSQNLRPVAPDVLARSFLGILFGYFVTGQLLGQTAVYPNSTDDLDRFLDVYFHGILNPAPEEAA